jgi:hypothetical protein
MRRQPSGSDIWYIHMHGGAGVAELGLQAGRYRSSRHVSTYRSAAAKSEPTFDTGPRNRRQNMKERQQRRGF